MNHRIIAVAVVVASFVGCGLAQAGAVRQTGLSPVNRFAAELIDVARARSATVRDLERAIDASNVVVYVHSDWRQPGGPAASVRWLTEAAGVRYVLLFVDVQAASDRRVELLGHELRHVVELADAAWVHNESDLGKLYAEIGRQTSGDGTRPSFESAAALAAERQVHRDLWKIADPAKAAVVAVARR